MNSPFPGMDPFLEPHWGDVHHSLIQYLRDALQPNLPSDLRARVEERVFVESDPIARRRVVPDVRVFEIPPREAGNTAVAEQASVAVAEPYVFELQDVEVTEGYIEIRERGGGRVITVIEVLSPANKKPGPGRRQYLQKQKELLASDASLVEIDLLRAGRRVLALPERDIPRRHRRDSLVCISPSWRRTQRLLFPMPLRERLSRIGIPLRESDPHAEVDLQQLVAHAYETGGYDDIDYAEELDPPLTAEEAAWVKTLVPAK